MLAFAAAAAVAAFANSYLLRGLLQPKRFSRSVPALYDASCMREGVEGIIAPYACNEDIRCTVINAMIHTQTHKHTPTHDYTSKRDASGL